MAQYRILVGIDYPPNKRAEAGEVVSDLPGDSIKWLLEQGLIESADGKSSKKETTYIPEAKDADKDGIVQDGTEFQRPAGTELTSEEITNIKAGE